MSGGAPLAPGARCRNCEAPLAGRFCSTCGQAADVHVPTTHELVHEALEGLTHSDSRLWRTLLALWFRPGLLTLEFIRGRRAAYLPPFRLYLVISVVFFLLALNSEAGLRVVSLDNHGEAADTLRPLSEADCAEFTLFRESHPAWYARIQHGCLAATRDSGHSWQHLALGLLPKAMFLLVPLVALLHSLMYWRPRHRYAEHLVFFLHLHALFFTAATLSLLLSHLGKAVPLLHGAPGVLDPVLQLAVLAYVLVALKRVFARGWLLTTVQGLVLLVAYALLLALTMTGVFLYAALQL